MYYLVSKQIAKDFIKLKETFSTHEKVLFAVISKNESRDEVSN